MVNDGNDDNQATDWTHDREGPIRVEKSPKIDLNQIKLVTEK